MTYLETSAESPPPPPPPSGSGGWNAPPPPPTRQDQPKAPPPGGNTILLLGILAAVVILALVAALVYLATRDGSGTVAEAESTTTTGVETTTTEQPTTTTTSQPPTTLPSGYATPEEALLAELPAGWIYELAADQTTHKEYRAGEPQSEWASTYVIEGGPSGGWEVTDIQPLGGGSDVPPTPEEEVLFTVEDFLYAIMEDRPDDAQALTVEPFRSDPASASYSNGDFHSFQVEGVETAADGTYWVTVTEHWAYGTDTWRYHAVPTEAGWRISELRPSG